jgi:5-formyltetrahydrofolate cyclo-ligase
LGQGGGHYDRTFAAMPDAVRIGLGYAGQQVGMLELEPHDIRLHGVLTEVGYTPARKVCVQCVWRFLVMWLASPGGMV